MSDSTLTKAIILTVLLFFTTVMVGWVGSAGDPSLGQELIKLFEKEIAGQIDGKNPVDMCLKIFFNNLEACILLFLGGASFGVLTIIILSLNGIVIGSIMEIVSKDHTALFVAAAILPHGIFEIPAFILSGALGILLAQSLIAEWYGREDTAVVARSFGRLFILYVLPLVALAAFVEAFITPVVIHLVA
jgi:stage II sporulation protein M